MRITKSGEKGEESRGKYRLSGGIGDEWGNEIAERRETSVESGRRTTGREDWDCWW